MISQIILISVMIQISIYDAEYVKFNESWWENLITWTILIDHMNKLEIMICLLTIVLKINATILKLNL